MKKSGKHYRVEEVLRQGDTETVERVTDEFDEDAPARIRKRIKLPVEANTAYERLYKAQRRGSRFEHLPRILECYRTDGELVVVMEAIEGQTLQDMVHYRGPSPRLALFVFGSVCDAAFELHEYFKSPIIHNNLSPSNIIINEDGAHLIGFGVAGACEDAAQGGNARPRANAYKPPEEQPASGRMGVRGDIYALGMVLCYLLIGQDADASAIEKGFADDRIPVPMRAVLMKATAASPLKRCKTAADLKADFTAAAIEWRQQERRKRKAPVEEPVSPSEKEAPVVSASNDASLPEQSCPSQTADERRSRIKNFASRISNGIGIVWNILLVLLWLMWFGACIFVAGSSEEPADAWPLWARVLAYVVYMGGIGTIAFCTLLDKRRLHKRFPKFPAPVWWKQVLLATGASVLLALLVFIPLVVAGVT